MRAPRGPWTLVGAVEVVEVLVEVLVLMSWMELSKLPGRRGWGPPMTKMMAPR